MKKSWKMIAIVMAAAMMAMTGSAFAGSNVQGNYTPVYMFYSSTLMDYMLTASETEKEATEFDYRNGTGTYEYYGILCYGEAYATSTNVPVYRFWNKDTADHFYTTSETEKQAVEADYAAGRDGYRYEEIAFYVPAYGYTPVYRFFDDRTFTHKYITDEYLKDSYIEDYRNGIGNWRYEGVAWYY